MQKVDTERKENVKNYVTKYSETETKQTKLHQLLERGTETLNVPSAARRLFREEGPEVFALTDLGRDELVYVSCGERWISPELSIAQQKRQIFLRNLASDVSKIQTFCRTRKTEALVLEVQSDIVSGAKLAVQKPVAVFGEEKQIRETEEKQMQKNAVTMENASSEILDSHARAHLQVEARHPLVRSAWQETSRSCDEHDGPPKKREEELFDSVEPQKKHRTFHLVRDPELVLAVSMTSAGRDLCGYPDIVQGYYYLSSAGKKKMMLCLACGQSRQAEKRLKQLLPGLPFLCASGSQTQKPFSRGPFKVIKVAEAEKTLSYYEDRLLSLRMRTRTQVLSHSGMAATHQKALKIIAYKNGDGYRNGKLIVAGTFPMLLTECTERLGLTRAASKVFTQDGTAVHSLLDLILWALDKPFIQRDSEEPKEEAALVGTEETAVKSMEENPRMKVKTKLFPLSAPSDSVDSVDKSSLVPVLRDPVAGWVSCGEPFLSPSESRKTRKTELAKKDKILADLDTMKHRMRQLRGRRVAACQQATMVPNRIPARPVVVEGDWTEQTQEEIKLMELIRHSEAHLSEVQELQHKRNPSIATTRVALKQSSLYKQPNAKRLWIYPNGGRPEDGTYAWGRTIPELLDDCSSRLRTAQPARTLYTPDGEPLHLWDDIERDMVICVSTGHGFITQEELKQLMEVRANYARIRRQRGPEATDVVVLPSAKLLSPERKLSSPTCEQKTVTERPTI